MSKRRKQAVEAYHDRVAGRYDHSYEDAYWQWHDALTWEHIKRFLPRDISAPVVDLGCGTGKWAAKLVKSGYSVTCVDISLKMVDAARKKLQDAPPQRVAFVQADLCDLSAIEANRFALAVAMGDPIGCSSSPAKALKEIRRILTADGLLVATFDNRLNATDYYLQSGSRLALEKFLRDGVTRWLTQDADERFEIHTYTPGQLRGLMERAGFDVVDMLGKTVLPMRAHRHLLADGPERRAWMKVEKSLCRDEAAMGRASHLQVVGRVGGCD